MRRPSPGDLTDQERANVRAAMKKLRKPLGSQARLAEALRLTEQSIKIASAPRRKQTAKLALAVARAAGVTFDAIITGAWLATCPTCNGAGVCWPRAPGAPTASA